MQNVSSKYLSMVYSRDYARHFVPDIIIKAIDVNAPKAYNYTTSEAAFYSSMEQITDDIYEDYTGYGTCEHRQYFLDGSMKAFSVKEYQEGKFTGQIGFMSKNVSDAEGKFNVPVTVTCVYDLVISTAGRTLFFNDTDESFPTKFTISFYRDNTLVHEETVTNTSHIYRYVKGVANYNKVVYTFLETKNPESRVKLIEDVPGLFLRYEADKVITLGCLATIDILSDELLTGEYDITLRNDTSEFTLFNDAGLSGYIQRRQEVAVGFKMIYPDNTSEKVKCGTGYLTTWKNNSTSLSADITARDVLDRLFQADYIRGMYSTALKNYYDIAVDILQDAGIEDFVVDSALKTMYTYGIVPICNHKEALRLVAQATQSVILPMLNGSVEVRYIGVPSTWPNAVDELDDTILYEPPVVSLADAYKSVSVNKFSYTVATTSSEIHKETRSINGATEVVLKFSRPAANCTIAVSGGTLVSSTLYTNAAKLVVSTTATADVTITITGYEITSASSLFTVDNTLEPSLVPDAKEETIDNPLITQETVAKGLAAYRAFWRARRYIYEFDWRQNPALDLLDMVKVHDDFEKNYVTVLVEQRLDYSGGALSGSSKSIY